MELVKDVEFDYIAAFLAGQWDSLVDKLSSSIAGDSADADLAKLVRLGSDLAGEGTYTRTNHPTMHCVLG